MRNYDAVLFAATKESQRIEGEPITGKSFDNHLRAALACQVAAQERQLLHPRVLHHILFEDLVPHKLAVGLNMDRGDYRPFGAYVDQGGGQRHSFPAPTAIPELMEEWWRELISAHLLGDLNSISVRWDFHAWFEAIHPFFDGNGRTGRLLWWGMAMLADAPIEVVTCEDRYAYYDRLEEWRRANCNKPLMNPFR
ncbi:hypothetical protein LCGC14_2429580 [marine sediment metagenome]|uniref:Fido domain-containing protein n=1 Tax=marine sediment metagenome TaxID=412755 RepID=A0A0F9EGA5_9ZZZZ